MARINPYLFRVFALAFGACAMVSAQTGQSAPQSHVRVIPGPIDLDQASAAGARQTPAPVLIPPNLPFSIENGKGASHPIRILAENEMPREDRDLLANAQSSIEERAGYQNLEFDGAGWTYSELVCPAMPNHMFVRFTRDNGTRQASLFSAAIPRNGNGRVHIIPIVRKGYSLFSPAPIGALTMAAFNRIRTEEGAGATADWLGTALCYAALAGANPKIGDMTIGEVNDTPAIFPPSLAVTAQGGAEIRFADVSAMPAPMQWTMFFDPNGKLVKAEHSPAYVAHFEKSKAVADPESQPRP